MAPDTRAIAERATAEERIQVEIPLEAGLDGRPVARRFGDLRIRRRESGEEFVEGLADGSCHCSSPCSQLYEVYFCTIAESMSAGTSMGASNLRWGHSCGAVPGTFPSPQSP